MLKMVLNIVAKKLKLRKQYEFKYELKTMNEFKITSELKQRSVVK